MRGLKLVRKWSTFLAGLLMGLASTGLILLLIRQPKQYPIQLLPPPTPGPLKLQDGGWKRKPPTLRVGGHSPQLADKTTNDQE
ncbi:MAG: hypothetical protein V3V46_01435 [Anaerolineales bacterium]